MTTPVVPAASAGPAVEDDEDDSKCSKCGKDEFEELVHNPAFVLKWTPCGHRLYVFRALRWDLWSGWEWGRLPWCRCGCGW
jgi:hypothetical protein